MKYVITPLSLFSFFCSIIELLLDDTHICTANQIVFLRLSHRNYLSSRMSRHPGNLSEHANFKLKSHDFSSDESPAQRKQHWLDNNIAFTTYFTL